MALQFVLGSSGSGKSNYLYETILKKAKEEPEQLFFWIVPEQFTMQTQRELVKRQENNGIMNIDVLSFQRLAYRIFDELGLQKIKVLEETGKNFVLRKVAEEKKDHLRMLKGNMKKSGYINEVRSVISEMAQYRIGTSQLEQMIENENLPAPFRYRMKDIHLMYQGFKDYLQGNYITAEEILEVLAQEVGKSTLLKNSVVILDGFTGFMPIQYILLEELMKCTKDIYMAVTLDKEEDPFVESGVHELFYMSKKIIQNLAKIAEQCGVEINQPIKLPCGETTRFKQAEQLSWLEQNLFRTKPKKYTGTDNRIFLYSLPNPRQELLFLAGEIKRLIREEGYRYQDIAVVCGDVEMYGNYVPDIFNDFEIPYFLDKKDNISFHPLTEMIKTALKVIETDFSYESIMAYLRCGLSGISTQEIDRLENYILANRIRWKKSWMNKWVRTHGIQEAEELDSLNHIRETIVEQFGELSEKLKPQNTVLEKTIALYQFIVSLGIQQQLEDRKVYLEQKGRLALAREYEQIYKIVMDLLNKLTQLLGEETMDLQEYRKVLESGFEASMVGIIPPAHDRVLIGDIERTRLPDIKVLFFAGMNDGLIPKAEKEGGLISQQDRELFSVNGLDLAPGIKEKAFMQRFYLYVNLTKPSEKLYLTWFRTTGEGKEIRKSYLVGMIRNMFENLTIENVDSLSELQQIVTPKGSQRILVEGLGNEHEGELSQISLGLLQWYRGQENWNEQIEKLFSAMFYTYEKQFMSHEVAQELYGKVLENSVTRLEKFAACAYAHFMSYGIGARERQLGEFAPVDMGNLFHEALERYSVSMEELGYHWIDVPKEQQEQLAETAVMETVEKAGYMLYQDARTAYTVQRVLRILKKTIETITSQISKSNFTPEGYEVSFSFAEDLESVNFDLSEEEKMRLRGRIDRVDTRKEGDQIYVKVVDYKSGNTQFQLLSVYHGLQLQLVVYMNAAVEILKKKYPGKEILPAGMFYYHIDDPVIDVNGKFTEEQIKEKVFEELKLNGVGTEEGDVSVSKKSHKANREELNLLSKFVNNKIKNIGSEIYQGDIQINPYKMTDKTACDYCPYHSICGFDRKVPGYDYRKLSKIKDEEEIMEKMRKEVSDGN